MLTYIISGSNQYTIRTEPSASSNFTMSLQDMTTQVNTTASLSGVTYNSYESMLSFTASIANPNIGQEFRAIILNDTASIWHGSIQVFASQSITNELKSVYTNQNDGYVSNVSSNEYIIL
jgi:hypothetical protein